MSKNVEQIHSVKPGQTLKEAMEKLNQSKHHICFVTDDSGKLIGSITDGDVRRALLKGAQLDSIVGDYMNRSPKSVTEELRTDEIIKHMNKWGVRQLPVLNSKGEIVKVETIEGVMNQIQKPNRIILMAGGLGKRLSPLTDHIPKPLLHVDGVPILEHIIRRFKELGFPKISLSVKYKSEMIIEYFGDGSRFGVEIDYLIEDKPLGTCGALSLLKEEPKEPFFVMNGDLLTRANFSEMLNFHNEQNSFATMCVKEHVFEVPYGVVRSIDNRIVSIEEKPKEVTFINAGIYILSPEALKYIDTDQFLDMPTLFMKLKEQHKNVMSYNLRDYWLDIGRMEDFHRAQNDYEKLYKL